MKLEVIIPDIATFAKELSNSQGSLGGIAKPLTMLVLNYDNV